VTRRATSRRWTLDELIAAKKGFAELLGSGAFGTTEKEVTRALEARIRHAQVLGREKGQDAEQLAWRVFAAELDAIAPNLCARLFPIATEGMYRTLARQPRGNS
jgi:hypothetical protein